MTDIIERSLSADRSATRSRLKTQHLPLCRSRHLDAPDE
jgi:hypothetical protein